MAPLRCERIRGSVLMRIGVISDTHGLLRPEALRALAGARHLIHAGDIGTLEVLEGLRAIAPITAVRGNNDCGAWAQALPEAATCDMGGVRLHLLHDLKALALDPVGLGIDVVVAGHSHRPCIETRAGVIYLNPGSAGPRRFRLPVSVAWLEILGAPARAHIVELPV
jgi:putative phosphoesterase